MYSKKEKSIRQKALLPMPDAAIKNSSSTLFIYTYKQEENGRYTPEVRRATYARPSSIEECNVTQQQRRKPKFGGVEN